MEHFDRVRDITNTTGTGPFVLELATPTGYNPFSAYVADGAMVSYCAVLNSEFEVGTGVFDQASSTLTRLSIVTSSNSGNIVDFSAGAKDIFLTPNSESFPTYLPRDPTANDNPTFIGKEFINTATGEIFVCTDNTIDANKWTGNISEIVSISIALG